MEVHRRNLAEGVHQTKIVHRSPSAPGSIISRCAPTTGRTWPSFAGVSYLQSPAAEAGTQHLLSERRVQQRRRVAGGERRVYGRQVDCVNRGRHLRAWVAPVVTRNKVAGTRRPDWMCEFAAPLPPAGARLCS